MKQSPPHRLARTALAYLFVTALAAAGGCGAKAPNVKPEFSTGEGAIAGQLVGTDKDAFDVSLAGDKGAEGLKIELLSPSTGVAQVTYPHKKDARFAFSHVKPGRYEISVYAVVTGKRSIAGSQPVVVDAGQVAPVTVTLTVTQQQQ